MPGERLSRFGLASVLVGASLVFTLSAGAQLIQPGKDESPQNLSRGCEEELLTSKDLKDGYTIGGSVARTGLFVLGPA